MINIDFFNAVLNISHCSPHFIVGWPTLLLGPCVLNDLSLAASGNPSLAERKIQALLQFVNQK